MVVQLGICATQFIFEVVLGCNNGDRYEQVYASRKRLTRKLLFIYVRGHDVSYVIRLSYNIV